MEPDIASIAALIGELARAPILLALLDDYAGLNKSLGLSI
jgi:hypothetical protein